MIGGVRGRLVATIIGLVGLTSLALGGGAYLVVAASLRDQQLAAARDATNFAVAVLAPERLPPGATRADLEASGLIEAFLLRGASGAVVDFGDGDPYLSSLAVAPAWQALSPELRTLVAAGRIGWQRLTVDGRPFLVTGAREPGGPDFYFFFDATEVERAIEQLGQAVAVGSAVLVLLAAVAARTVARRVLEPVRSASAAAERISAGDLSTRLAVDSADEFGRWAEAFNRMAASLEATIDELRAAQARERRFVADVSHELRTPLTALVAEAGLLRDHLDRLPADARRAAELLAADVGRLRGLVEELMELSRLDAGADPAVPSEVDLWRFLGSVVASRCPTARIVLPEGSSVVAVDRRRLERIVGNLVDNAVEHGEGRDILVDVRFEPDALGPVALELTVADRGPGVPPGELDRLFERFHKGDPSRRRGGSGLGLAIAREHARAIGGSIEARLRSGGGLAVIVRLPVTRLLPDGEAAVTDRLDADLPSDHAPEVTR